MTSPIVPHFDMCRIHQNPLKFTSSCSKLFKCGLTFGRGDHKCPRLSRALSTSSFFTLICRFCGWHSSTSSPQPGARTNPQQQGHILIEEKTPKNPKNTSACLHFCRCFSRNKTPRMLIGHARLIPDFLHEVQSQMFHQIGDGMKHQPRSSVT